MSGDLASAVPGGGLPCDGGARMGAVAARRRRRRRLLLPALGAVVVVAVLVAASVLLAPGGHRELVLATTTSTYDSGLLDRILPDFERRYNCDVKVVAVGSGEAMRLGEAGDADVLLVHSPAAEITFVANGYGLYRRAVMYNTFVLVGPDSDGAGVRGLTTAAEAFQAIAQKRAAFCSRGDDSGTHSKEKAAWKAAGLNYSVISSQQNSDWYLSLGQGMGDTLRTASEKKAYALTDDGTFYSMRADLDLVILVSGDATLINQYHVIPVNATRHPDVEEDLAVDFADWIVSARVQTMIDGYVRDGMQLFTANAEGA